MLKLKELFVKIVKYFLNLWVCIYFFIDSHCLFWKLAKKVLVYLTMSQLGPIQKGIFSGENRSRVMSRFNFGKKAIVLISLGAIFLKAATSTWNFFADY